LGAVCAFPGVTSGKGTRPLGPIRTGATALALALGSIVVLSAAGPDKTTLSGWTRYVAAVETRLAHDVQNGPFLAIDAPERADERRRMMAGAFVTTAVDTRGADGAEIDVPNGLAHDWRGDVLIPGATLDQLLGRLERAAPPAPPNEVLTSRIVEAGPGWNRVALTLRRQKVISVVYATEHLVTFRRLPPGRAVSSSIATKITELADYGTASERPVAPSEDRGLLWRWNAYWRFQETPGGVIAECESITLSRDIPGVIRFVAGPIIRSTARESMTSALEAMRRAFRR
jgi:hypothetical protein